MFHRFKKQLAAWLSLTLAVTPVLANPYEFKRVIPGLSIATSSGASSAPVTLSATALDFTGKVVGQQSQKSLVVTNTGTQSVPWVQAPVVSGNSAFSVLSGSCAGALAPGASCALTVQFSPTQVASVSATLSFSVGGLKQVLLTGSGDGSRLLDFTNPLTPLSVPQGKSATGTVVISNNNNVALVLGSVGLTSQPGGYFGLTANTCNGKTLQPSESCTATVVLDGGTGGPAPAATVSAVLSVPVSGVTQSHTIPGTVTARDYLTLAGGSQSNAAWDYGLFCFNKHNAVYGGTKEQYACSGNRGYFYADMTVSCATCIRYLDGVSLSTLSMAFGAMTVGVPSSLQLVVQNDSAADVDLSVLPVTLSAGVASNVALTTSCDVLKSGDSCLVQVTITPSVAGTYSGRLTLTSDAEGSPYYVSLSGTSGFAPSNAGVLTVPTLSYGDAAIALAPPTSDSPGAWSFTSSNPAVATVTGTTLTPVGGGISTITAVQAAVGNFGPTTRTATLTVQSVDPVLGAWPSVSRAVGETVALVPPTSTSTGAWTYTSSDPAAATVTGGSLLLNKAGTYSLTATQAATNNYKTASANTTLTVSKGTPVLGSWAPLSVASSAVPFALSYPSSTSTGGWSATSSNPSVATVSNGVVTVVGVGTTTLNATQATTSDYVSATASTTLTVGVPSGDTKLMWQFNGTAGTTATAASITSDTGHSASTSTGVTYVAGGVQGNYARFNNGTVDIYSQDFQLSNKPFTFEWWQRGTTSIAQFTFGNPGTYSPMVSNGSYVYMSFSGGTWNIANLGFGTISSAAWTHMAVVRTNTGITLYKNGVAQSTAALASTTSLMTTPTGRLSFGSYAGGTTADIDQVRLTIGTARYNGNFTPSTTLTTD